MSRSHTTMPRYLALVAVSAFLAFSPAVGASPAVQSGNFPARIDLPNGFFPEGIEHGRGTSFFVGSADPADDRHADAVALLQARPRERLVTSNHVLGETWTFLRRRRAHRAATRFGAQVERPAEVPDAFVDAAI